MSNGVVKIAEFSDSNTWTKALPNATTAKVMAATVNGVAATNTGIVAVGTTLPYQYKLAAVGTSETGDFLVCGWDIKGNFMYEKVTADSTTAADLDERFHLFPSRGFAYLLDNDDTYALDAGDDLQIVDSTSGTALILGNLDISDTNTATALPAIVIPPNGYAVIRYLAIAAGNVTAGTADYKLKVYDIGTAETKVEKIAASADNETVTWYDEHTAPYSTLRIDGGFKGSVAYLEATTSADDSAVSSSYKLTYDLYAKFVQGGIAGIIADEKRTASTQQS